MAKRLAAVLGNPAVIANLEEYYATLKRMDLMTRTSLMFQLNPVLSTPFLMTTNTLPKMLRRRAHHRAMPSMLHKAKQKRP